ncbi:hypothetical protein B7494_g2276 [Chlorociboria aeruginascens]|nr:hypothetical protein B7494_g2276 [Chlorociboria aeruginascens]
MPYALLIFVLGLILSAVVAGTHHFPAFKIWQPTIFVPNWISFKVGALDAGLGQIPLTTLNSIVAVSFLSADLLPQIPTPSVTSIGMSVALMNLVGGWFGAMPVCHGSGGLAAQYRFGARSGTSIILLGLFKVILGLIFGETLVGLLREYPKGLLGVMVFAAGLELAKVGENLNYGARDLWEVSEVRSSGFGNYDQEAPKRQRELSDEERTERWTVMFMTIGGMLAFKNDGVGFVAGMLCYGVYQSSKICAGWKGWRSRMDKRNQRGTTFGEEEQLLVDN